ncbi:MAG: hypothetical protein M3Y86_13330 [Verrucomicrobiota bacterium]|nr:hypothetical protein [Verrucomicrobiota bacterium]
MRKITSVRPGVHFVAPLLAIITGAVLSACVPAASAPPRTPATVSATKSPLMGDETTFGSAFHHPNGESGGPR